MEDRIGNLLVGQSGGPTAVINSTLAGVISEAMAHAEIGEIYGMANGIQGLLLEEIRNLRWQDPDLIHLLRHTPAAALGSCRYKLKSTDLDRLIDICKAHNIRYFLYIGGNDSAETSWRVSEYCKSASYDMKVIGLPKTVDNDLPHTDHCPGYASVARYMAISTMEAGADHRSLRTVDAVKIIEAMGRNAGWITAAAALGKRDEADPPHLVYPPEATVSLDGFLDDVQRAYDRLGFATVVVSEALRGKDGKVLSPEKGGLEVDTFGHTQYGGVAEYLAQEVMSRLGVKARTDKPGTLQRSSMSMASSVDLAEAFMVGVEGVRAALRDVTGQMVILVREDSAEYRSTTGLITLDKMANQEKTLPDSYMDYQKRLPTQQFIDYALPLLGDPLPRFAALREGRINKRLLTG